MRSRISLKQTQLYIKKTGGCSWSTVEQIQVRHSNQNLGYRCRIFWTAHFKDHTAPLPSITEFAIVPLPSITEFAIVLLPSITKFRNTEHNVIIVMMAYLVKEESLGEPSVSTSTYPTCQEPAGAGRNSFRSPKSILTSIVWSEDLCNNCQKMSITRESSYPLRSLVKNYPPAVQRYAR